jgi:hypothetical protein
VRQIDKIYNFFLTKLNDNTLDLTFYGNSVFEFSPNGEKFAIHVPKEDSLVLDKKEYAPTYFYSYDSIGTVTKDKRRDWQLFFNIAIPIQSRSYAHENDDYLDWIDNVGEQLNGEQFEIDGKKANFKVEPLKLVGYFDREDYTYIIVDINVKITVTDGRLDNETGFTISTGSLDPVAIDYNTITLSMSKVPEPKEDKRTYKRIKTLIAGQSLALQIDFNYLGSDVEQVMLQDLRGLLSDYKQEYTVTMNDPDLGEHSYTMHIIRGTEGSTPNSIRTLNIEMEETNV